MFEKDKDHEAQSVTRKLGDEWSDWKGRIDPGEIEIDENPKTFLFLALGIIFIFSALFPVVWYLIGPRIEQFSPNASNLLGWVMLGSASIFLVLLFIECISLLKFRKSLFHHAWVEKILLVLLPKTVWLGGKFGVSRDRVGNSFIKVHNLITRSYAGSLNLERLLILLPRCLKKEARNTIMNRLNGDSVKVLTAGGGEEARKAIMQYRPSLILALACERDLMSGIRDVAEKIPVLAIPNKRPEGPCKNTDFSLSELDEALEFLRERKKQNETVREG